MKTKSSEPFLRSVSLDRESVKDRTRTVKWEETEHFQITRRFLDAPERFFQDVFRRS